MKTRSLNLEEAFGLALELPFFYQRNFSSLSLGENPKTITEASLPQCFQLLFFDESREIRFFLHENQWKSLEISQEPEDEVIASVYPIQNKIYGKTITLKKFLDYDEDGQCYVKATTLSGWEG